MIDKVQHLIKDIKNPITGKTLLEEKRILEITQKQEQLHIKYLRAGISPEDKRKIDNEIYECLSEVIKEDELFIHTVSQSDDEILASMGNKEMSKPTSEPAQIKVGHATVGNKRKVEGVGQVIAIGSGKGGVGKSTFTANLALTLTKLGKKVGIVDADIYGPSIPMLMGKRDVKPTSTAEKKIVPIEATNGVKFISFGLFIAENDPVIWRGPMLGGVLSQFLFDVDWRGLDYLLIDLPPGTGDIQLSMVQNCEVDGAIIISTPQDVALLDAKKGYQMFKKVNLPVVGMVENMSSFICDGCGKDHKIFGSGGVEKAVEELGIPYLGGIPIELELRVGSDTGVPYMSCMDYEGRPVWNSYISIGQKIIANNPSQPTSENKSGFMSKIFGK
jgi:ATP-binding protein involved in chromosome partitioning